MITRWRKMKNRRIEIKNISSNRFNHESIFFLLHSLQICSKKVKIQRSIVILDQLPPPSFNFSPLSQRPSENLDHEILKLQSITITITSIIAIIEHRSFLLSTFFSSTSTAFEESRSQK